MAERKTAQQKKEEIEKKIEQLQAQKKAVQAQINKEKRAQRTRRLIQNGALAEKYLGCEDMAPEEFEKVLAEVVKISEVKKLIGDRENER